MRAIITGAGPCGLVLAYALQQAGITDFIVLERKEHVVEVAGAGLGLWPQSVRILDQLGHGLLEDGLKMTPRMTRRVLLDKNGDKVEEPALFSMVQENHGHGLMVFERWRLIKLLYTHLPNHEKHVLTGKNVTSVTQTDSDVTVTCSDGTSYTADILLGADGVHSPTRRLLMGHTDPSQMAQGFSTSFKVLFGVSPAHPATTPGVMIDRTRNEASSQLIVHDDLVFWSMYIRQKTTTTRTRYTEEDIKETAERYLDYSVGEKNGQLHLGDLWRTRLRAHMVDLEEGVLDTWFKGRVVWVGDAVHKMTPNIALGCNSAMESVASLANQLHSLLQTTPSPTTEELESAFATYQKERQGRANTVVKLSGNLLKYSWTLITMQKFMGRFKFLNDERFPADHIMAKVVKEGVVLDFVRERMPKPGRVPWVHRPLV